ADDGLVLGLDGDRELVRRSRRERFVGYLRFGRCLGGRSTREKSRTHDRRFPYGAPPCAHAIDREGQLPAAVERKTEVAGSAPNEGDHRDDAPRVDVGPLDLDLFYVLVLVLGDPADALGLEGESPSCGATPDLDLRDR